MAVLHSQFTEFNKKIKLTSAKKGGLKESRKGLKKQIKKWFNENKKDEIQPKFWSQGSFEMNTIINPIPKEDDDGNTLLEYDLDLGIYFIDSESSDGKNEITTWHNWIYESVENYTKKSPKSKTTCIRVIFSDGHHIDLPIYYQKKNVIELAHKSKGWIISDPKEFYEWFNSLKTTQLERIVRYLKAWKNYRDDNNSNLRLPSGFALTILASNMYVEMDNDDEAFLETIKSISKVLNQENGFKCYRPTTPSDEDIFSDYSDTRKTHFLYNLRALIKDCENAKKEKNKKNASVYLHNQFGSRFPLGPDIDDDTQSKILSSSLASAIYKPKPFSSEWD